jgi:hypothetical protein
MKATTALLFLSAMVSTAVATPVIQREGMSPYLPSMIIIGIQ